MGSHRAEVEFDTRPAPVTPATYMGKRRSAAEAPEPVAPAVAQPASGKRRAAVAADVVKTDTVSIPAQRSDEVAPLPAVTGSYDLSAAMRPLFAEDTRTDLPRIDLKALELAVDGVTDFSGEPTVNLPVVAGGGKRRAGGGGKLTRNGSPRRRFSIPLLAGVAALAVAGFGAVHTTSLRSTFGVDQLVAANALTGTSGSSAVGRAASVSRDSSRVDLAEQAAEERNDALNALNTKATDQDAWLSENQWSTPIPAGQYIITGRFGDRSWLWSSGFHTGLDFAAPWGTPIHAVAPGVITSTGWNGAYGNLPVETLADGTELWYGHQSKFGSTVGQKVTEGEVIGFVGSTGNTTGTHVHLEVRPGGGDPVDPDAALKAHGIDPDAGQESGQG